MIHRLPCVLVGWTEKLKKKKKLTRQVTKQSTHEKKTKVSRNFKTLFPCCQMPCRISLVYLFLFLLLLVGVSKGARAGEGGESIYGKKEEKKRQTKKESKKIINQS